MHGLTSYLRFIPARLASLTPSLRFSTIFSLRTWISSVLAFWIACKLQLDSPQWAMLTVWIVSKPQIGMMISRSLYRMWGTLIGCIGGMLLVIFFAQTPELFVLALALLMGVCTLLSNLLTNFRSYAAVLAGYTAAIIALGAVNAPETIFFVAMARVSCILLGITCTVVISALFASSRGTRDAMQALKDALGTAAHRSAFPWSGDNGERRKLGRQLVNQLIALDAQLEFASAESGVFRQCRAAARSLPVHLFAMISAKRGLDAHVRRCGYTQNAELLRIREDSYAFLDNLPPRIEREEMVAIRRDIDTLVSRFAHLNPEAASLPPEELVAERTVIDRFTEMLCAYGQAVDDWLALQERRTDRPMLKPNFHRDQRSALIHGFRAFLTVGFMGAFWIATAWPSGAGALIILAVIISLFSTMPHPDKVGWNFFAAGIMAFLAALLCKYYFLNRVEEYEIFGLILGLFMVPFGILSCYPRTALFSAAFPIVFLTQVGPANLMEYDLSSFLNNGLATQVGILAATLAYILVFPPDVKGPRNYVLYRVRLSLEIISQYKNLPPLHAWSTRMYDRVSRLQNAENPEEEERWLFTGLEAVDLGAELYRLRALLEDPNLPRDLIPALEHVRAGFKNFVTTPKAAEQAAREAVALAKKSEPGGDHQDYLIWARTKSVLEEINGYFQHPECLVHQTGKAHA